MKHFNQLLTLLLISILGYFLKYGLNLILSHYLTITLFGEFNLAVRVLAILMAFALLGTDVSSKRFVAHYLKSHDERTLRRYIQWNFRVIKTSFLACIFIGIGSYILMRSLHVWHIKEIRSYHMAVYMLWVAPVAALFTLFTNYLICANQTILSTTLRNVRVVLYILLFIGFIQYFNIELRAYTISLILLLSFLLLFVVECLLIYYKAPVLFKGMRDAFLLKRGIQPGNHWLKFSSRMAVNNLVFILICAIDLFLVEFICPDASAVGLYSAALVIASFVLVIPQNLYTSFKTEISHYATSVHGRKILEHDVKRINRLSFTVSFVLGLGIIIFSKTLLSYFGPLYFEADVALKILTLGFMATTFSQPASLFIVYSGNESMALQVSIVELAIILVAGIILTYFFGIVGTAMATSLSILIKTIYFHVQVYAKLKVRAFVC